LETQEQGEVFTESPFCNKLAQSPTTKPAFFVPQLFTTNFRKVKSEFNTAAKN
jgi:hypothetical protein